MNWDDIDEVLYGGTKKEISNLKCPDCGGCLSFSYSEFELGSTFVLSCIQCFTFSRGHNGPKPNCAKFFRNEYTIR